MSKKKFKKVILHVGVDKTGSTAIQNSMVSFQSLLLENGVFYPDGWDKRVNHHTLASCFSAESDPFVSTLLFHKLPPEKIIKRNQKYIALIREQINAVQADTLVFSWEGFVHLSGETFRNFKTFLKEYSDAIEIVFYARPPLSYGTSAFSQQVKEGNGFSDDFSPAFPYKDRLETLIDVFGKEQINLRSFEKTALPNGNVVEDFLLLLNLPKRVRKHILAGVPRANKSLTAEAISIGNKLITISKASPQTSSGVNFKSDIGQKYFPRITGHTFQLTERQRQSVLGVSKPHTDYLAAEFGLVFKEEQLPAVKPLEIAPETIGFAAKALLDVVISDSDTATKMKIRTDEPLTKNEEEIVSENEPFSKQKKAKFKKVILHVGPDKTGSTSIQSALGGSRELLLENNVFYPLTSLDVESRHHIFGSCFTSGEELFVYNPQFNKKNLEELLDRDRQYLLYLSRELDETQADIVVLSCEGFVHLSDIALDKMKRFLDQYCDTVEVVLYARAPLSYATSAMSQRVKTGKRMWQNQHIPILIYEIFLKRLSLVFGKHQLNVRLYSKESLPQGNVVLDFLSLLNLSSQVERRIIRKETSRNPSLSQEGLLIGDRMVELLNGYIATGREFRKERNLGEKYLPAIQGRKIHLTDRQQEIILAHAKPHLTYLNKEFGIHFHEENQYIYQPLAIYEHTIDFTAKVLLNVLVPDFDISVMESKKQSDEKLKKSGEVRVLLNGNSLFSLPKLKDLQGQCLKFKGKLKLRLNRYFNKDIV